MRYHIPAKPIQQETEIKKSRFIVYIKHISNRHEAETFLAKLRKRHPQCSHVCWAYIAGPPNTTVMSMSDDGEPNGTAGKPMLNTLCHSGLGEVIAVVVRYFGGIKLGTGGLQRAYSGAVKHALKILPTIEKNPLQNFSIQIAFSLESDIRHTLHLHGAEILSCSYQDSITIDACIAEASFQNFCNDANNITSGKALIKKLS